MTTELGRSSVTVDLAPHAAAVEELTPTAAETADTAALLPMPGATAALYLIV